MSIHSKQFLGYMIGASLVALVLPFTTHAQATSSDAVASTEFSSQGIFGCGGAQTALPVGAAGVFRATNDPYVPVSDLSVTTNTGNTVDNTSKIIGRINELVYKECVLDILQKRIAEQALADLVNSIINNANTGRQGAPKYVVDKRFETRTFDDGSAVNVLQNKTQNVCSPYRDQVRAAIAREYMKQSRTPESSYSCPSGLAEDDLQRMYQGEWRGWKNFSKLVFNPSANPFGGYVTAVLGTSREIAAEQAVLESQWNWGRGYYPDYEQTNDPNADGWRRVITPAYVNSQITRQAYLSGFTQLENSDEIGEVISATFAGLSNQIVTSPTGFSGLSGGGVNSYLNQLANNTTLQLRDTATSIGSSIVANALAIEQQYNAIKQRTRDTLMQTAGDLRAAEDQCFVKVVQAVEARAAQDGARLNISTSTQSIAGGSVDVRLASGTTIVSGSAYALTAPASAGIESASFSVSSRAATTTSKETPVSLPLNSQPQLNPPAGGSVALSTAATSIFGAGTLKVKLAAGGRFPVGTFKFGLNPVAPFTQAIASIVVQVSRRFADTVIASEVTPVLSRAEGDLQVSNNALTLLNQLQAALGNTNDPQAQQQALLQLDDLTARRLIHNASDLQTAQAQSGNVSSAGKQLVENTVKDWTTGGNWCNVDNPNVVQAWYDQWKI